MEEITFRKLRPEDAEISWHWRNDPEIWKYTGRVHRNYITKEIEQAWIEQELAKEDVNRFAICIGSEQRYIGNIHLTFDESGTAAECHIFIGDKELWGKGIASSAMTWFVDYARKELPLKRLIGKFHKDNEPILKLASKLGFSKTGETSGDYIYVERLL